MRACLGILFGGFCAIVGALAVPAAVFCEEKGPEAGKADDPNRIVEPTEEDKALAARAEKAVRAAGDSPGREAANSIHTDWIHNNLLMLKGERRASGRQLAAARQHIAKHVEAAEKGSTWPKPPVCKVPFCEKAPTLDGKLDDPAWEKAAVFKDPYPVNEKDAAKDPKTTWRVMWDGKHLYFGFECEDSDLVAPKLAHNEDIYNFDCVEAFILPKFADGVYWEIEVSPSESLFEGLQTKDMNRRGSRADLSKTIEGMRVGVRVDGTLNKSDDKDKGYSVEIAVPWERLPGFAGKTPEAGMTLHFMLLRMDRNKDRPLNAYSFIPLLSWSHNIWNYAKMELTKP